MNDAFYKTQTPAVKTVDGKSLARRLPYLSDYWRAALVVELASGATVLRNPTRSQMCRALCVSERSAAAVSRSRRSNHPRPLSDAALDRFVARVGPERVFNAFERLTAPV
jgi:hypothetical protein